MKFTFEDHPRLVRALTLALVAVCLYAAGFNFYHIASVPTDENVFRDSPSAAFIRTEIPARFIGETDKKIFDAAASVQPDLLRFGDAVVKAGAHPVKTLDDLRGALRTQSAGDSVDLEIFRASNNKAFIYKTDRKLLTPAALAAYTDVVVVTSVLPGGASDRAGMKTGDIIFRINDSSFTDALSADKMLRQGQVDKSLRYDIYRDGRPMSLLVTLARFGVTITAILLFCVGLFYMGMGAFLALKRPSLIAARLLGWGLIAIASVLMTVSQGREPDLLTVRVVRMMMTLWGVFGGVALFTHSFFYFPKEKTALLVKKRHRIIIYVISMVFGILTIVTKMNNFFFGVFLVMGYFWVVKFLNREKIDPAQKITVRNAGWYRWVIHVLKAVGAAVWPKSMMRGVRGSLWFIVGLILLTPIVQPYFPDGGIPLANILIVSFALFPLAYLYTIGRYQLLDMTLRIRRNLQYSAITIVWNTALFVSLLLLFFSLPDVVLPLQNVEFTGASILITDTPVSAADFLRNEKIASMVLGLAAVFCYVLVRRKGQTLIDEKYYRTQFDYRRALSELSEALAAKLGMEDLARGLVSTLVDLLQVKQASVLFFRNGDSCCCIESAGKETSDVRTFCNADLVHLTSVLKTINGSTRVEYLPVHLRGMLTGMGICIVLPIRSKDQLIGALLVSEKLSEAAFKDEDISFLNSAAMQASVSIENAFLYEELAEQERMKHELEIARKIQLASLPQEIPQMHGLDIAGSSLPAMEVGGDFYDYLETDRTKVTVVIGDVSGKGTSAALYMSKVQGILRSLFTIGLTPRELFVRANRLLCRDLEKRSFVTVLGAEFDLAAHTVRIARAGHLPLFCYNAASHTVEKIVPPGIGLGLNDAEQPFAMLEELCKGLRAGDVYLFVSDGITEAHNDQGDEFGDDRLCSFIEAHHGEPSSQICERLFADVKVFAGAMPQHDDQTIVCIGVAER